MLTTRELEGDGFAAKKCAAWTVEFASGKGRVLVNSGPLEQEREAWAVVCNKALEEAGRQERICLLNVFRKHMILLARLRAHTPPF
jgi:hypothetical protein